MEAHATEVVFGIDPKPSNTWNLESETRQCHNYKEVGHMQSQCSKPRSLRELKNNPWAFSSQYLPHRQYIQVP